MARERKTYAELYAENMRRADTKKIAKLLKKSSATDGWVYQDIVGNKEMTRLLELGWEIVSHAPSNYSHAANHYVMKKLRSVLTQELDALSAD
jgi:hypothetical protein